VRGGKARSRQSQQLFQLCGNLHLKLTRSYSRQSHRPRLISMAPDDMVAHIPCLAAWKQHPAPSSSDGLDAACHVVPCFNCLGLPLANSTARHLHSDQFTCIFFGSFVPAASNLHHSCRCRFAPCRPQSPPKFDEAPWLNIPGPN
jgi:hypothetical protein